MKRRIPFNLNTIRRKSNLAWQWLLHLPRFVLMILIVQVSLMLGLYAYAWIRKRLVPNEFSNLDFEPIQIEDHQVQLFDDGHSAFEDMLAAIDSAQHVIFFESYLFERDEVGVRFKRALLRKAREGVRVYIIVDGIGSLHVPMRFKLHWWRKNVRVFEFGRLQLLQSYLKRQIWVRDHRKMLVVDGKVGYLGGMNIGREYENTWRDTQLKVVGSLAVNLAHDFAYLWNEHYARPKIEINQPKYIENSTIQLVSNRPFTHKFPIREAYLELIRNAHHHIWIANAYVIPDGEFLRSITEAARRGVDVQIMMPWISDNIGVDWMARSLVLDLLESGARVLFYTGTMLHSKTMTVDSEFAILGSANLDNRSLLVNYELGIQIRDQAFVRQMEAMFLNDRTQTREVLLDEWYARPILQQLGEWMLRPVRRFF